MKKLIYGSLFLALVGMGFVGCQKENITKTETSQSRVSKKQTKTNSQSKNTLRLMAEAAKIKSINYTGSDTYKVKTFINNTNYDVKVINFNPKKLVEMKVTSSKGESFDFKVNINKSKIMISGDKEKTYNFNHYLKTGISAKEPFLKNLIAVISVYVQESPNVSTSYSNDIKATTFLPIFNKDKGRKFMGYVVTYGNCNGPLHYRNVYHDFYFFWFHIESQSYVEQEYC